MSAKEQTVQKTSGRQLIDEPTKCDGSAIGESDMRMSSSCKSNMFDKPTRQAAKHINDFGFEAHQITSLKVSA